MTRHRTVSRWCGFTCALLLAGCFEVELAGSIRSTGAYVGTAELNVPLKARLDAGLGPVVAGPERDIAASWAVRGVVVAPNAKDKKQVDVRAARIGDLNLAWMQLFWRRNGAEFAYAHHVTLPPQVIGVVQARLESWLAPLAKASHHNPASPQALARGLVGTSKVVFDFDFPGPVTATDGERLSETRVRWTWNADDLMGNARPHGYAYGRIPWWRPWWDRLLDLVDY